MDTGLFFGNGLSLFGHQRLRGCLHQFRHFISVSYLLTDSLTHSLTHSQFPTIDPIGSPKSFATLEQNKKASVLLTLFSFHQVRTHQNEPKVKPSCFHVLAGSSEIANLGLILQKVLARSQVQS